MPSRSAMWRPRAISSIRNSELRCMAGMTFSVPILAVLRTPQETARAIRVSPSMVQPSRHQPALTRASWLLCAFVTASIVEPGPGLKLDERRPACLERVKAGGSRRGCGVAIPRTCTDRNARPQGGDPGLELVPISCREVGAPVAGEVGGLLS